jgi:hypothetical protein
MRFALALALVAAPLAAQKPIQAGRGVSPTAAIRVSATAGTIRIVAWSRDSVAVRGRLDPSAGTFYLAGTRESLKLGIEPPPDRAPEGTADLEVMVPDRSRLWVKAPAAAVDITGGGGSVEVLIGSGRVRLDGQASEIVAESIDGNIELVGRAESGRLRTASGIIVARGVIRDLTASSVSGPLLIGMEGAVSRAMLESVSGEIAFKGDLDRDGVLRAETHGGDIELRLPPALGARFEVVSYGAGLVNELAPALTPKPLKRGEWNFTMGSGEATVSARTFKGRVVLKAKGGER